MTIKMTVITLLLVILCSCLIMLGSFSNMQNVLSDKLIRLHIPANSDSAFDQQIKLYVRDAVCDFLEEKLKDAKNREDAEKILSDNLESIQNTADGVLRNAGADYLSEVTLCTENFDTRVYDDFTLPAGEYESLKISLGSGTGHNWWCVVFPPICAKAAESTDYAELYFTNDELAFITSSTDKVEFRFKILEFTSKIKKLLSDIQEDLQ